MKTEHLIPIPFEVPEGYSRQFVFEDAESGFQEWITVHVQTARGEAVGLVASLCLDWIAECITQVKMELGVPV